MLCNLYNPLLLFFNVFSPECCEDAFRSLLPFTFLRGCIMSTFRTFNRRSRLFMLFTTNLCWSYLAYSMVTRIIQDFVCVYNFWTPQCYWMSELYGWQMSKAVWVYNKYALTLMPCPDNSLACRTCSLLLPSLFPVSWDGSRAFFPYQKKDTGWWCSVHSIHHNSLALCIFSFEERIWSAERTLWKTCCSQFIISMPCCSWPFPSLST